MSVTLGSAARPSAPPPASSPAPARRPSARRRFRIVLIVLSALLLADFGISLAFQLGWLRHSLTTRLEAAFGRPIQVSNFSFSLLDGPQIEANYISVGEDPRFGNEYFLRADQVAAGIRWLALLRGKFEVGSLSISNPALNLVRLPDGEWNLESWLPHPPGNDLKPAAAPSAFSARPRLIEVSGGRINFKEGVAKLPFAFINVDGSVEQTSAGSWRINLEAEPFRAAVNLQQPGELSLTGTLGGTSSRLRPASLHFNWDAASISDVLRLFTGYDYGVRGLFSLQLNAKTRGYDWKFSSASQFRRLHRWDLPLRADDPAANLEIRASWHPAAARLDLTSATMEFPRSHIRATGAVTFAPSSNPQLPSVKNARLQIASRSLVFSDALAWYRAFHPGVAEQFEVHGAAALQFALAGWPPRIQSGEISSQGAEADGGRIPVMMRMEKAALLFSRNSVTLPPLLFSAGRRNGEFRFSGSIARLPQWHSSWKLNGSTRDVRSLFDAAESLGHSLPAGWQINGPVSCDLQWVGRSFPALRNLSGTLNLNGIKIAAPFLNRVITHVDAAVALSPQGAQIRLNSANAFAADWRGLLQKSAATSGWQFTLAAKDLSAVAMDRWLNPERRPNFLERILPFFASNPQPQHMPSWLRARGTLSIGEFALSPFDFQDFRASAAMQGRHWQFSNARANFYGGALSGAISLDLASTPSYNVSAKFENVRLGRLAARTFSLANLFSGRASGGLRLSAKGLSRAALLHSLVCKGRARMRNSFYSGMDLVESLQASSRRPGITIFPKASADFSCVQGRLNFSPLELQSPQGNFRATGYVDFQRRIHLTVVPLASDSPVLSANAASLRRAAAAHSSSATALRKFKLTGSLNAPAITRVNANVPRH